jgi:L-fuconolactonase
MIIDAHQHFWLLERGDYDWLTPDLAPLYRDFLPGDLHPIRERVGIAGTILVQAAATEEETRFCFALARSNPEILGVTGWADFEAPDFAHRLDALIADGGGLLKALRPMIQDIPDPDWVSGTKLDSAFAAVADRGLLFEALVKPQHLRPLTDRLARQAEIACVIDHCAKPRIANRELDEWQRGMQGLAALPQVVGVKLSGLLTEAATADGVDALRPYVDAAAEAFGTDRLIWGSDWPVLTLAASYEQWFAMANELLAGFSVEERGAIFGGNAMRIYNIEPEVKP